MDLWKWQFLRNPEASDAVPFFVLEVAGEIQGAIGFTAARIRIGDRSIAASHPVNFFVNDRFRGLPALRLIKSVLAQRPIHFAGYFSPDTLRLFSRLGFINLSSHVFCHYLPLGKSASRTDQQTRWILSSIRFTIWATLRMLVAAWASRQRYQHTHHDVLDDDTIDAVDSRSDGAIRLAKHAAYFQWRYAKSPNLRCRYTVQRRNGQPYALAVTNLDAATGRATILDIQPACMTSMQAVALIVAVADDCRSLNAGMIQTHLLNKHLNRVFRMCLFGTQASDIGLLVRCDDSQIRERVANAANWHFVLGDTDRF